MSTVKLYINGQQADLSPDSLVAFTYQITDFSAPAAVKNTYSKTVTLPGTRHNLAILNSINRSDYHVSDEVINPTKRIPFTVTNDGGLVESGYLKILSINNSGSYHTVSVVLYGALGDFFYSLQDSRHSGKRLTLADLFLEAQYDGFYIDRNTVTSSWDTIRQTRNLLQSDVVFVPAYNGIPDHKLFDPNKIALYIGTDISDVIMKQDIIDSTGSVHSIRPDINVNDELYSAARDEDGNGWLMVSLEESLTEWESLDMRSYLQRPAFSIPFFFSALRSYAQLIGYNLYLDPLFFNADNPYYALSAITLPLLYESIPDIQSGSFVSAADLFKTTKSPYDYLLSYAKVFNLYFTYDATSSTISILKRSTFYTGDIVAIDDIVDLGSATITPVTFDYKALIYSWAESAGDAATVYRRLIGEEYGTYTALTGYEFDRRDNYVLDKCNLKSAVDVRERSKYFWYAVTSGTSEGYPGALMPPWYNVSSFDISYYQWGADGVYKTATTTVKPFHGNEYRYVTVGYTDLDAVLWYDSAPRLQFHDSSNGSIDGSDVMVLFNAFSDDEYYDQVDATAYGHRNYYVSDDIPVIINTAAINDSHSCYINPILDGVDVEQPNVTICPSIPLFNRFLGGYAGCDTEDINVSLDLGYPAIRYDGVGSNPEDWFGYFLDAPLVRQLGIDTYVAEICDPDNRLIELDVALRWTDIISSMRKFYTFDSAVWILYKVIDYNPNNTLTRCQFMRVSSIAAYRGN